MKYIAVSLALIVGAWCLVEPLRIVHVAFGLLVIAVAITIFGYLLSGIEG